MLKNSKLIKKKHLAIIYFILFTIICFMLFLHQFSDSCGSYII